MLKDKNKPPGEQGWTAGDFASCCVSCRESLKEEVREEVVYDTMSAVPQHTVRNLPPFTNVSLRLVLSNSHLSHNRHLFEVCDQGVFLAPEIFSHSFRLEEADDGIWNWRL